MLLLGPGGALETLPPGGLVILMATIGPAALRELASEVTARGHRVVDAPVTGGVTGAIAGTFTVIASGAAADLEAAAPILKPMSGQVFHVGLEPGQGQMIKLVNQLLVGTHLAAAAEAMALARAAGADLQQVYDLLITGQARSQMFVSRVGAMLDGGFNTGQVSASSPRRTCRSSSTPAASSASRWSPHQPRSRRCSWRQRSGWRMPATPVWSSFWPIRSAWQPSRPPPGAGSRNNSSAPPTKRVFERS